MIESASTWASVIKAVSTLASVLNPSRSATRHVAAIERSDVMTACRDLAYRCEALVTSGSSRTSEEIRADAGHLLVDIDKMRRVNRKALPKPATATLGTLWRGVSAYSDALSDSPISPAKIQGLAGSVLDDSRALMQQCES